MTMTVHNEPVFVPIAGYCPACSRTTLMVDPKGGDIFCSYENCQRPDAASVLLYDAQESGHMVIVGKDGYWTAKHPLIERVDDGVLRCDIGNYIQEHKAYIDPGTYRITRLDDRWFRERLS